MEKWVSICVSALIIFLSFFSLYIETTDYQYQSYIRINENNEEEVVDTRNLDNEELMKQMAQDYFTVKEKNLDVVGWLNIPNIGYYPVTMGEDNQFYLTHNEYKEYSKAGIPFMNTECGGSFKDIALIHGHHMKSGAMFGSLNKYQDEEFFKTNDLITVFDGEYLYFYKPFTVTIYADGGPDVPVVRGMSPTERLDYLKGLHEKSRIKTDDEPQYGQVLLLSTCDYSIKNGRLLIGAYVTEKIKYNQ